MPFIFVYRFSHLKFTDISFVPSSRKTVARMYGLYGFILRVATTHVGITIAVQSRKRATIGPVGTKRLSLSGNQQVKFRC